MTYRYKFQLEMAREQRRRHWRRTARRTLVASAVLVVLSLAVTL
jgi:hypothetical protein